MTDKEIVLNYLSFPDDDEIIENFIRNMNKIIKDYIERTPTVKDT